MNTLWLRISVLVLCLIQFVWGGFSQSRIVATDITEASVQSVAMASLEAFLNKIPAGHETEYGFRRREEFPRANLGTAIQVFTLHPDSMKNRIDPKRNYMIPLNEWRVPVMINGEFRTLLTVSMVNNTLKTVELGGEVLAKEMMTFQEKEPNSRTALLRLYQLHCDFLILDRNGLGMEHGEFYPLRSAHLIFDGLNCSPARPCLKGDMYPRFQSKYSEEQWQDR
jgi:hypothetical protein